jgi:hypothetical protein
MFKFLASVRKNIVVILFFAFWIIYFSYFWSHAIFYDLKGNVQVTHVSIWGDWAAHFTMGSAMAERDLTLTTSPFLNGARFSYPFAANLISAVLVRAGVPFFNAFLVPSYIFSLFLVAMLFYFYKFVFKKSSIAILAATIFLFNGGTGFVHYFQDIMQSEKPLYTALNPVREYTSMDEYFIRWISVVNSQVVPQRAFTLGFPMAVLGLLCFFGPLLERSRDPQLKSTKKGMLIQTLGVLIVATLPLVHTHSFLMVAVILSFWCLSLFFKISPKKWSALIKKYLALLVCVLIVALPILKFFFFQNATNQDFIRWFPGWYLQEFDVNWFYFWFLNWGVTPILALAGLAHIAWSEKQARLQKLFFFAPFFVIFALANLFLFQPFIWDNTKLIVWSSLGISGLAGYSLHTIWAYKSRPLKSPNVSSVFHRLKILKTLAAKLIIISIFIFTTLSGAIDAWRMIRFEVHTYQMYSKQELELAEWVKINTPKDSLWLTGDKHNLWLYNLTGRQPMLTFLGWLWTHGYNYSPTERDVRQMFAQPILSNSLFTKYGIDYILIGDHEKTNWGANVIEFQKNFKLVKETQEYQIFQPLAPVEGRPN